MRGSIVRFEDKKGAWLTNNIREGLFRSGWFYRMCTKDMHMHANKYPAPQGDTELYVPSSKSWVCGCKDTVTLLKWFNVEDLLECIIEAPNIVLALYDGEVAHGQHQSILFFDELYSRVELDKKTVINTIIQAPSAFNINDFNQEMYHAK